MWVAVADNDHYAAKEWSWCYIKPVLEVNFDLDFDLSTLALL